ncbi:SIR2-like protein [Arcticibacter tournemirensis]|uniref:Uncharacterized protein n=1 Tax=Arcticibacter tournemirensis TaxID=699437 RepID=A0A5M9HFP4_9SPHI|nr:SIR2 family protein [Arcticibacter tournemirensis]KAA8485393.1 hypothetical protein F1649_04560 [Arcticibacter tournemirensis]TQM50315.1 SIR2-like protein [Arcticibacter tournemirensis]
MTTSFYTDFTESEKEVLKRSDVIDALDKLNSLLLQNKRIFLIGAGCSKCVGLPLMNELTTNVLNACKATVAGNILNEIRKQSNDNGTIEDFVSELIDYLAIGERRSALCGDEANATKIKIGEVEYDCSVLRSSINLIKEEIRKVIDQKVNIDIHRLFVRHLHNTQRPGKPSEREKVDYIILNYDTLFEDALAFENITFVDGLSGNSSAYWCPELFCAENQYARVIKLHGSIDWILFDKDSLPRRVSPRIIDGRVATSTMIYPATTKYAETQLDPFARLFDVARSSLKTYKESQKVLVIIGYSFGDAHINREVENALLTAEGHLTVIIFANDENNITIKRWRHSGMFGKNVLVYADKGVFHGTKEIVSLKNGEALEWWKFEKLTKLIRGEA